MFRGQVTTGGKLVWAMMMMVIKPSVCVFMQKIRIVWWIQKRGLIQLRFRSGTLTQPRNVAVEDQSNRRHMTGNNGCDLECWWSQSRWPWTTSTCSVSDRWFADQICGVNWCYSSRGGWHWTTMMTRYWSNSWITRTMTTMATNSDSGDFMTTTTVTDDDTLLYQDAATTVH